MHRTLTPELLIEAYKQGLFPMADSADSPQIQWVCPKNRAQLFIKELHIPRSLKKKIQKNLNQTPFYKITLNTNFPAIIQHCAETNKDRTETWINDEILNIYIELHKRGHAHSIEYWSIKDGQETLSGGLYGLALGGAFFGESMFSRTQNASKIALIHLAARLWKGGYSLLDTQFTNDHLKQFGIYEIPHNEYKSALDKALLLNADLAQGHQTEADLIKAYFSMRKNETKSL